MNKRSTRRWLSLLLAQMVAPALTATLTSALATAGCVSEEVVDDVDPEPKVMTCTLGGPRPAGTEGGVFVPLVAGAEAELTLGFQGFVWIDISLQMDVSGDDDARLALAGAGVAKVALSVEIDGLGPTSSAVTGRFDANAITPLRLLLAPADVGKLKGRSATMALRASVAGLRCDASGSVVLRDDDACIHVDDAHACTKDGKLP